MSIWKRSFALSAPIAAGVLGLSLVGCFDSGSSDNNSNATTFRQVNLVADTSNLGAPVVDQNLTNPWGIAASSNGSIWVADNETGMSTVYDKDGNPQSVSVVIPSATGSGEGKPTGMVANNTPEFLMPNGSGRALFLFVGEDGAVSAWNTGDTASIVIRSNAEAVYKGMALATDAGKGYLYLANFPGRSIEAYDGTYQRDMSRTFVDSALPADYGPFNVALVGGNLYVAYAKIAAGGDEEEPGVGNGIIDVFTLGGKLVKRFATGGALNAPWGIAQADGRFGPFRDGIYVGNFGDGLINVFDTQGNSMGQVQDSAGTPVKIEGLWALYHDGGGKLYFTAGPEEETHGIFGYLSPQ